MNCHQQLFCPTTPTTRPYRACLKPGFSHLRFLASDSLKIAIFLTPNSFGTFLYLYLTSPNFGFQNYLLRSIIPLLYSAGTRKNLTIFWPWVHRESWPVTSTMASSLNSMGDADCSWTLEFEANGSGGAYKSPAGRPTISGVGNVTI